MLLRVLYILIAVYALKIEAYDRIDSTMESEEFVKKGIKFPQFGTGKSRFSVQKRKEPEQLLKAATAAKKYPQDLSAKQTRFTLVRTGKKPEANPSANDLENNSSENDNKKYPQKDTNGKRYKIVQELLAETLQQNDDEEAGLEIEDPPKTDESAKKEKEYPQFDNSGKSKYVKEEIPGIEIEIYEESGEFQKKKRKLPQFINSGKKRYKHVKRKEKLTEIEDNSGKSFELDIPLDGRELVIQHPKLDIGKSKYAPVIKIKKPTEVYDREIEVGVFSASETIGEEMKHSEKKQLINHVQSNQTRFKLISNKEDSSEKYDLVEAKETDTTSKSEIKWYPQQNSAQNYKYKDPFNQNQKSILRSDVGGAIGQPPGHSNRLDPSRLTPKFDQRVRWKLDKGGPRKKIRLVFFDKRPTKVFGVDVFSWMFLMV